MPQFFVPRFSKQIASIVKEAIYPNLLKSNAVNVLPKASNFDLAEKNQRGVDGLEAKRGLSKIDNSKTASDMVELIELPAQGANFPYKTIVDIFEEQVFISSNSTAVSNNKSHISYNALNERANQLAHYLLKQGVTHETLVPICIERSIDMIVGILGILKAGAVYVPIDPVYPIERIGFIINDISASLVITSKNSSSKLTPFLSEHVKVVDTENEDIGMEEITNPGLKISPNQLAYIIYTSGSTGKPKGVMIEHASVVSLLKCDKALYDFNERDVWTMFHSFCFDFSVWEIFGPLFFGGRLVVVPEEVTKDSALFTNLLVEEKVTILNQTPSAFYVLQEQIIHQKSLLNTRYVIFGGESLNPLKLMPWKKTYTDCKLINMYGITETTVHVTYQEIGWTEINNADSIIGKPIPTLEIYLLDDNLQPVDDGETAEMYVSGAGLARGYLNRSELTAERFITLSLNGHQNLRLYKTGDLASRLPDGRYNYQGRIDNQVKIRGYRIELGEIENVMLQSGMVQNAVVVVKEEIEGNKLLAGYYIPNHNFQPHDVHTYVSQKVPAYMTPSRFIALKSFPLTTNGKTDRKYLSGLPLPLVTTINTKSPTSKTEVALAKIWMKVLVTKNIGISDDFFELGGNSIQAARIFTGISKEFSLTIPVSNLVQAPTIEKLAALIDKKDLSTDWGIIVPYRTTGLKIPVFLLHAGAGDVLFYKDLVNCLPKDQPLYGIRARGLDGKEIPHNNIEEMASDYVNVIINIQPHGPYLLAGYCFGAMLCFEICKQLNKLGEQVALLANFNGISPGYVAPQISTSTNNIPVQLPSGGLVSRLTFHFGRLARLSFKAKKQYVLYRLAERKLLYTHLLKYSFRRRLYKIYFQLKRPLPPFFARQYYYDTNWLMSEAYKPEPHDIDMIVFRSQQLFPEPTLGWKNYIKGKIETIDVPGYHENRRQIMNEPHVTYLAKKLQECLDKIVS